MRSKKTDKQILEALQKCWNEKVGDSICDDCAYAKDEPIDLECLSWLHDDAANLLAEKEIDLAMYGDIDGIQGVFAKVNRLEDENRALRTELATNKKPDTLCPANEQEAKADAGKPRLTLVPPDIVYATAEIEKYDQEAEALLKPQMICKTEKKGNNWKALFRCPYCGETFEANISNVTSGRQRSCGCAKGRLSIESKGTHGDSKTRLYRIYHHILERCNNPSCKEYQWYGERGIQCEFDSYESFRDYATENGYRDDLTCERIDVNGNYAPGNITFIPLELQARNTRSNVMISYKGLTLCAAEWAEIMGVRQDTITKRKRSGWSDEKTIETPVKGSADMSLVPIKIIEAIRNVRLFGLKKYGDPNNWKRVSKERYRDAAFRHFMRYLATPHGVDEESGLPHLWHCCCNLAFLCELEGNNDG